MSDDIYDGDSQIGNPGNISTEFHQFALTGSYRVNSRWLFTTRIPFTDATRTEAGQPGLHINGLSDISVAAIYSPWIESDTAWRNLSFSAGLILPTGEPRDNPRVGAVAPSVLQLGTGSTQLTLGVRYFGSFDDDWSYFSNATMTLPLYESSKDFLPAETFFLSGGISRSLSEQFTAKLSANLFHGGRDEFLGMDIGNTGSTVFSLTPSLVYSVNENLSASASVAIPLYRRVNETALAVGPVWTFGLSYSF